MDRITGPVDGYFVASYACEMGELGDRYLGFAKVCCCKPASFWLATLCDEPGCCAHLCGGGLFDTPEAAVASAELLARAHIRNRNSEGTESLPHLGAPSASQSLGVN